MSLSSWEECRKASHQKLIRGDFLVDKGAPNGPFRPTKSKVCCFLALISSLAATDSQVVRGGEGSAPFGISPHLGQSLQFRVAWERVWVVFTTTQNRAAHGQEAMFKDSGTTTKYRKWHFPVEILWIFHPGLLKLTCSVKSRFLHPRSGKTFRKS